MKGPEAQIEAYLKKQVDKAGGKCLKFVSPGYSGVTDRIVIVPGGRVVFIEVKNGNKGQLTKLQLAFAKVLDSLKADYEIIRSKEDVHVFIERYF